MGFAHNTCQLEKIPLLFGVAYKITILLHYLAIDLFLGRGTGRGGALILLAARDDKINFYRMPICEVGN
jgi:hypothetical protein